MRRILKVLLTLVSITGTVAVTAGVAASPAFAATPAYRPPSISLECSVTANDATVIAGVCVLPFGVTTAPNAYSATIAVSNSGAGDTFALSSGSLPPGLTMPAQSGPGTVIAGNPTRSGTYDFSIKATSTTHLTATRAYQITITVQGPPDQLLCNQAGNGGFLVSGVCELPDAVLGLPYQGHLITSHAAGGTLGAVAGSLPPGLSLSASFGSAGAIVGGTPSAQGIEPTYSFTVQGSGDQGQPLNQAYQITVDQNLPLAIVLPSGGSAFEPGNVGQAFAQNFFLSGGAGPYTWSLASGKLPPGLTLQTFAAPTDANDELAGTPTATGVFTFTMRLTDYSGQQVTQQFTLAIES